MSWEVDMATDAGKGKRLDFEQPVPHLAPVFTAKMEVSFGHWPQ